MMLHVLLTAAVLAASAPGLEVQLKPLAGPNQHGTLTGLSPQQVVVTTSEGAQQFTPEQLLAITADAALHQETPTPAIRIALTDKSQLAATSYATRNGKASVRLLDGDLLEISTRSIRSVRFRGEPALPVLEKQWETISGSAATGDVLVVRKSDVSLDQLEGVLSDIDDQTVQFEFDGERIPVPRTRLEGLLYYHPQGGSTRDPVCQVIETSGNIWNCRDVALNEDEIRLVSTAGIERALPLSDLRKIDFSSGNVLYLSDLQPEQVQYEPYVGWRLPGERITQAFRPRGDRSFSQDVLRLGGESYDKGLAVHSRTKLVYRIPADYRRFRAVVGIDDLTNGLGSVRLVISGDGKPLLERTIAGGDEPLDLELDIRGMRRLELLVDYGEQGDVGDHLNFCEARITK